MFASVCNWEWFHYCIFKLFHYGLKIGTVAWTSQCHSCRLALSELHITASDSSAEVECNQVMLSAVWFLCTALGRTISTTCLQKAVGVEEKWTVIEKKRIEKVCSGGKIEGERKRKVMIVDLRTEGRSKSYWTLKIINTKGWKTEKNTGNSVRVIMFSTHISTCTYTHLCFCDCYQAWYIFQSSLSEVSPWSLHLSTFRNFSELLQFWRKNPFQLYILRR